MNKMAFIDLCNFVNWPMGGMIQYELMILETLEKVYEIDLWGVSVDGECNREIQINGKTYPLHIFANVKSRNRIIPNYWKGLFIQKYRKHLLNYDIIYVHTGSCLISMNGKAQTERPLLVYHQHGLQYLDDHSIKTVIQKPFMNSAQKRADFSLVVTGQEELEAYVSQKRKKLGNKLSAIGSPIEGITVSGEMLSQKIGKDENSEATVRNWSFIYTGRLAPIKNVPKLIEVFALFCRRGFENSSLVIVGDGEEYNAVCRKIEELGLEERVLLTGEVEHKKVQDYLQKADFYITASKGEGVSVAVLEAYAAGVPVVCFPVRGLKEQVKNAVTGYIAEDHSLEAFADAMKKAVDHQRELSYNSLDEAGRYQKEIIGRQIVDEFEKRQRNVFD